MPTCRECGAALTEAHAKCAVCGAELGVTSRSCPRCEEDIATDADACPACGHMIVEAPCDAHPDRSATGECVICGRRLCEKEPRAQQAYLCEAHEEVTIVEGWAQAFTSGDDLEAQLIRDNLQAEGVDARVLSQKDHHMVNVGLGDFSVVRVLVPAFAYVDARRILREHMDAEGVVRFACANCGEAYDTGDTECANCGAPLR